MRVVCYVRVSTEDQSPESQEVYLREFAKSRNLEIVEVFRDVGVSGFEVHPLRREGFKQCFNYAVSNRLNILVISLDRISRNYDHLIEVLTQLSKHGVQVISVQEEWLSQIATIPDETLRKLIYDIVVRALAYGYEMYVKSIREKTRAGLLRAKIEGKRIGRPRKLSDKEITSIKLLAQKGLTIYEISKVLGISPGTVKYWLSKTR